MISRHIVLLIVWIIGIAIPCTGQDIDSVDIYISVDSISIIGLISSGNAISKNVFRQVNGQSFIKNYEKLGSATIRSAGPGLLTTILRRGMASRHTGILWEGFNIQSVVNGTFDAGLISNTFNDVRFLSHDAGPFVGNASIAGALNLDNVMNSKRQKSITITYGSDENLDVSAIHTAQIGRYNQRIGVQYDHHQNRYNYFNGNRRLLQNSARFSFWDINYKSSYRVNNRLEIKSSAWIQNADRRISPSKTSVNSIQEQEDKNIRFSLSGNYNGEYGKLIVRTAFFNEELFFDAPGIESRAKTHSYNAAADFITQKGWTVSGQYRLDNVIASFFTEDKTRSSLSTVLNFNKKISRVKYSFSLRPQWIDGDFVPLTFNAGVGYDLHRKTNLELRFGRAFTLPSFNDLYWPIGGNPSLLSETSNNAELNLKHYFKGSRSNLVSINLYFNLIDNWIQWIPIDGVFQPVNQRKIRNMGVELSGKFHKTISDNQYINLSYTYTFVDSRLAKHYIDNTLEGKRTIFIPAHKAALSLEYHLDTWGASLSPIYYSKRYDTVDNSKSIPGYTVIDFQILKSIQLNKISSINMSLSVENIADNDYENIRFFPMPLRIFRLGVQYIY